MASSSRRDDDDELVAMSPPSPSSSSSSSVPSGPRSSSSSPAAATAALLASFLLLSSPLVLPPPADAAVSSPSPSSSSSTARTTKILSPDTATSIDINLRSLSSLTRKAVVNREKLTSYLVDSLKSTKPILDLLSEGDAPVLVSPPKDVRGAIDRALTRGDATFVINGDQVVDVRLESVPGVIIVRVINPSIPRLPFLGDGTAALQFVDGVVDAATPAGLEKAASGARAVGDFLTWGAPRGAPIRYGGSSLDVFMSSKFGYGGTTDLTNAEVVFLSLAVGIGGAYASSYAYYASLQKEAEREAGDKKAKAAEAEAAKKKKETETAARKVGGGDGDGGGGDDRKGATEEVVKTKKNVAAAAETTAEAETTTAAAETTTAASAEAAEIAAESTEAGNAKAGGEVGAVAEADEGGGGGGGGVVVVESADVADNSKVRDDQTPTPRSRKRDAIMKNLFGRGIK